MDRFEEAARQALSMPSKTEYVESHLRTQHHTALPEDEGERRQLLRAAFVEATGRLVVRVVNGVIEELTNRQVAAEQPPANLDVLLAGLRNIARAVSDGNYLLQWFINAGFEKLSAVIASEPGDTVDSLYRRLRHCALLNEALDAARQESDEEYAVWLVEAVEQLYAESVAASQSATDTKYGVWPGHFLSAAWKKTDSPPLEAAEQLFQAVDAHEARPPENRPDIPLGVAA